MERRLNDGVGSITQNFSSSLVDVGGTSFYGATIPLVELRAVLIYTTTSLKEDIFAQDFKIIISCIDDQAY